VLAPDPAGEAIAGEDPDDAHDDDGEADDRDVTEQQRQRVAVEGAQDLLEFQTDQDEG